MSTDNLRTKMKPKLVRATFKKSDKLKIVSEFGEFKGKNYLNVRQHIVNKTGEFVPTPAGFNIEDTPESIASFRRFLEKTIRLIDERP